jgi:hypothetical protein
VRGIVPAASVILTLPSPTVEQTVDFLNATFKNLSLMGEAGAERRVRVSALAQLGAPGIELLRLGAEKIAPRVRSLTLILSHSAEVLEVASAGSAAERENRRFLDVGEGIE